MSGAIAAHQLQCNLNGFLLRLMQPMASRPAGALLAAWHCWRRSKHCLASSLLALDIPTFPQTGVCMVCSTCGSSEELKVDGRRKVSSIVPLSLQQTEGEKVATLHHSGMSLPW